MDPCSEQFCDWRLGAAGVSGAGRGRAVWLLLLLLLLKFGIAVLFDLL